MVDVVIGLKEKNHKGKIFFPFSEWLPHSSSRPYPRYSELVDELKPPYDLVKIVQLFRKHVKKLRELNITGEAAVDSLRPLHKKSAVVVQA
jgi:hypothetical protein